MERDPQRWGITWLAIAALVMALVLVYISTGILT